MNVREYTDADLERVKELHRQSGFEYDFPDLADPSIFAKRVVFDSTGIGVAGFLRSTAEVFAICDPTWRTAAWRDLAFRNLQTVLRGDAAEKQIGEAHAFLPPEIEKHFGRRLLKMGWRRYVGKEWRAYSIEL